MMMLLRILIKQYHCNQIFREHFVTKEISRKLKRYDEAFAAYDKALALKLILPRRGLVAAMFSTNSSATTKPSLRMTRRWH